MRPFSITKETSDLLAALAQLNVSKLDRLLNRHPTKHKELFERIAERDELGVIPALANYLAAPKPICDLAATAIERILQHRGMEQLSLLDQRCRIFTDYSHTIWGWNSMKPDDLSRFAEQLGLQGVFSFHPNGWIRQMAVESLIKTDHPSASKFLWLRLNDWVEPIRTQALTAIQKRLDDKQVVPLSDYLPLVTGLKDKGRADLAGLQRQFEHHLLAEPTQLYNSLSSQNFRTRRDAYDMVWRANHVDKPAMLKSALADADPLVRLGAAKHIAQAAIETKSVGTLEPLWRDTWFAVRVIATRAAIALGERELLWRMVADTSRTVREASRFYLRSDNTGLNEPRFIAIYHNQLTTGNVVVGLLGLAEIGQPADMEYVKPYLNSDNPRVVEASVFAYKKLAETIEIRPLLKLLPNAHPRISRAATRSLMGELTPQVLDVCRQLIAEDEQPRHVQLNAYRLLVSQSKWARLIAILTVIGLLKTSSLDLAQDDFSRWFATFNQSFAIPTSAERAELNRLVATTPMDSQARESLESMLTDST